MLAKVSKGKVLLCWQSTVTVGRLVAVALAVDISDIQVHLTKVSSLQIMMHPYGRISQVHAGFLHQVHVQFVGVDSSLRALIFLSLLLGLH